MALKACQWGGIEVTVAQHTNGFQTIANNGNYLKRYMVEQIIDRDGDVVYKHEADPVRVYSPATATIMQDLLRGVITSGATTTFKSRISQVNPTLAGADWIGKTGTTNSNGDMWLMLSTPNVSLGGWIGHDNNASMQTLTGYNNNAQYMAQLANAIYQADPSLFGIQDKFTLDKSVIRSEVLKSTGERPGRVNVNGRDIDERSNGDEPLGQNGAPTTQYRFAIGDRIAIIKVLGQRFSVIPVEISRIIRTIRQPIVHPAIVQIETAQIVAIDTSLIQ